MVDISPIGDESSFHHCPMLIAEQEPCSDFSVTLNLPSVDNKPTVYNVQAVFEGDNPQNASAYAYTPNGTRYAICTTVQYGYKPASNATWLTVTPQSTQVMQATKTPEQMQQEAEQSGWLTVWHEFSWSYPWYRMHVRVNVNPTIDIGFNPILPGGEVAEWNGLGFFSSLSGEVLQTIGIEAFGLIATYLAAKYTSIGSVLAGIAIEFTKIVLQSLFLVPNWNSADAMLASALMSAIMLLFAITDFGSTVSNFLVRMIDELKWICGGATNALTWVLVKLKDMFLWGRGSLSWVVDLMEILADAAFTIITLRRYLDLLP
jgi:hypothetical protein